jgi:hypothetical protein
VSMAQICAYLPLSLCGLHWRRCRGLASAFNIL